MIQAICFDLDGVFFTEESFRRFKSTIAELSGEPELMDEVFHGEQMNLFKQGKISEEGYWDYVNSTLNLEKSIKDYKKLIQDAYEVNSEVEDYVKASKSAGYTTCICTNNFITRIEALNEKFNFLDLFDVGIISFQVGILKPNKEIFEELIRQTDIEANQIVYSDDNPGKLSGASELGIYTFVYENFEQFTKELNKLGVTITL